MRLGDHVGVDEGAGLTLEVELVVVAVDPQLGPGLQQARGQGLVEGSVAVRRERRCKSDGRPKAEQGQCANANCDFPIHDDTPDPVVR